MLGSYDDILTLDDVCKILYIGKNTAYRLLSSGELKGFKIGRVWKIPKENLEFYISKHCPQRQIPL